MAVIFEKILGDIEGNRSVPCWQMEKKRSCILMIKLKFLFDVLFGKQL